MAAKSGLAKARARLRDRMRAGWQRAVFRAPGEGAADDERVLEAPEVIDDEAFGAFWTRAKSEFDEGRVKITVVLDERRRLEVDGRHGFVKTKTRDEATVRKQMGGKERPLRPDRSADLLRVIGIMNADGSIPAKRAKKYKQVNHLVELLRPAWSHARAQREVSPDAPLRILDLGCGTGALPFVLDEALALAEIPARTLGVDLRDDVIRTCRERATRLDRSSRMSFEVARIADAGTLAERALGGAPDIVIALHACDTATDEALALALELGAAAIFAVPCCHAELARQLAQAPAPLSALSREGLLRRARAEVLTDGIRIDALTACGYAVDTLEFVASEHTPKNLLIRARGPAAPRDEPSKARAGALAQLRAQVDALGVRPRLLDLLDRAGSGVRADIG